MNKYLFIFLCLLWLCVGGATIALCVSWPTLVARFGLIEPGRDDVGGASFLAALLWFGGAGGLAGLGTLVRWVETAEERQARQLAANAVCKRLEACEHALEAIPFLEAFVAELRALPKKRPPENHGYSFAQWLHTCADQNNAFKEAVNSRLAEHAKEIATTLDAFSNMRSLLGIPGEVRTSTGLCEMLKKHEIWIEGVRASVLNLVKGLGGKEGEEGEFFERLVAQWHDTETFKGVALKVRENFQNRLERLERECDLVTGPFIFLPAQVKADPAVPYGSAPAAKLPPGCPASDDAIDDNRGIFTDVQVLCCHRSSRDNVFEATILGRTKNLWLVRDEDGNDLSILPSQIIEVLP